MYRRFYLAALAALMLTASAIPTASAQEQPAPDPAAAAAEQARQAAERAAAPTIGPRFVPAAPGYAGCQNEPPEDQQLSATIPAGFEPKPGLNGGPGWQVSAPRGWPGPTHPGDAAELSLRDKYGTATRRVTVEVVRPDGTSARGSMPMFGDRPAKRIYPTEFELGAPLAPGVYTVIWRTATDQQFIACDGFVVEP